MSISLVESNNIKVGRDRNAESKVHVSIDGENFFWIIAENCKIISKNPTKEDLRRAKEYSYNETNICPICREEYERERKELTDESILYPRNDRHNVDKDGKETGEWVCKRHGNDNYQKYNSKGQHNIVKELRNIRTGNQNPNSSRGKGDNFEELTDRWLGVKKLDGEYDNYNLPLDHSQIPDGTFVNIGEELVNLSGKIPQTKGRYYNKKNGWWNFSNLEREWYKNFDCEILWCASTDGKTIERGYIIPKNKIYDLETKKGIKGIGIYKVRFSNRYIWYEQYRIKDPEDLKKINETWEKMQKRHNVPNTHELRMAGYQNKSDNLR